MQAEETARRPASHADARSAGPCEGRRAAPSNPNPAAADGDRAASDAAARAGQPGAAKPPRRARGGRSGLLGATLNLRCSEAEKALIRAKAEEAGVGVSALLREALGLTQTRRRKAMPRADPALVRETARIGANLNQMARRVNAAAARGALAERDALAATAAMLVIERQLERLIKAASGGC